MNDIPIPNDAKLMKKDQSLLLTDKTIKKQCFVSQRT